MAIPVLQAISAGIGAFNALNSVFGGDSAKTAGTAASAQPTAVNQEDRFLKLLVTQMRNQDPLNPLDNAQVTSQMAQISTVSGIDKLNGSIEKLSQSMMSSQSLQSVAMIGRQVLAAGSTIALGATGALGAYELAQAADRVEVTIATPAGAVVRRLELGQQAAGTAGFQWDGMTDAGGRAAPGNYVFQVTASGGGKSVAAAPFTAGLVSGVSFSAGSLRLNLDSGTELSVADVRRIL
ncbi:MAG: flagellar hook assembly protein FlgD [Burkholderiales bacterium]|nr:flagellar hook assembly protein FlgD [Burkholderiales bacterium]MDP2399282.1 flagellar hook assembly protein FlgD [Burkholderiales bacterium]